MTSYEKVRIQPTDITGPGGSLHLPPEVFVCIECGSMVWPSRVSLHDAWHGSLDDLVKQQKRVAGMYSSLQQQGRPQQGRRR